MTCAPCVKTITNLITLLFPFPQEVVSQSQFTHISLKFPFTNYFAVLQYPLKAMTVRLRTGNGFPSWISRMFLSSCLREGPDWHVHHLNNGTVLAAGSALTLSLISVAPSGRVSEISGWLTGVEELLPLT